jgi:hypothetical protein
VPANSFGRERLVDDVLESFGDLDSIFSLPGGDQVDSMSGVGRGKLWRTTTQRLLKRGTILGAKSGDGASMDPSGG